jgi:SOS-response transcriptional repressor LexA
MSTTSRVLRYIILYKRRHDGVAPTVREIMDACGISSTSVVAYHLKRLEAAGKIICGDFGSSRAIEVVGGRWVPPGEVGA